MERTDESQGQGSPLGFSFVRGGLLYRAQRAIGLVPDTGLGVGRRIAFFIALTWVPAVLLAAIEGRVVAGTEEPLLRHFGVHARCLVAIPAFLIAESVLEGICFATFPQFQRSGLVDERVEPGFRSVLQGAERLRDSWAASIVLLTLVALWTVANAGASAHLDELSWAVSGGTEPELSWSGWWYLTVTRPVFVILLLLWLWRLLIAQKLFRDIARLDLRLVPTHPDRAAGLGFLEYVPIGFAPVVFGISAVVGARFGHDILYHGAHVTQLRVPLAALLVIVILLFLTPFAAFSGKLRVLKRESLWQYGSLIGRHGRLVHRRWILGESLESAEILDAPELGCVADANAVYDAVANMRPTPLRQPPLVALAASGLVPLLAMATLEVPLKDILATIARALF